VQAWSVGGGEGSGCHDAQVARIRATGIGEAVVEGGDASCAGESFVEDGGGLLIVEVGATIRVCGEDVDGFDGMVFLRFGFDFGGHAFVEELVEAVEFGEEVAGTGVDDVWLRSRFFRGHGLDPFNSEVGVLLVLFGVEFDIGSCDCVGFSCIRACASVKDSLHVGSRGI